MNENLKAYCSILKKFVTPKERKDKMIEVTVNDDLSKLCNFSIKIEPNEKLNKQYKS